MANTYDNAKYTKGSKVAIHELMHGKPLVGTVLSEIDTWTGGFYENSQKKVYELSVILDNGRVTRVPYHFLQAVAQ